MVGKSTIFLCVMASSSLMIPPGCAFLFFGGQASQSVEVPFQALCNLDGNIPGLMGHIHGNIPVFFLKCDHLPYFIGYSWGSKSYWCVRFT